MDPVLALVDELIAEIGAYLRVVDAFRREGAEPVWAAELSEAKSD